MSFNTIQLYISIYPACLYTFLYYVLSHNACMMSSLHYYLPRVNSFRDNWQLLLRLINGSSAAAVDGKLEMDLRLTAGYTFTLHNSLVYVRSADTESITSSHEPEIKKKHTLLSFVSNEYSQNLKHISILFTNYSWCYKQF